MIKKEIVLTNPKGIHARPSAMIVQTGQKYQSKITIIKSGIEADACNIMEIIALGAQFQEELEITTEGPDEEEAMKDMLAIFERKFDDEPK
ncbi:HPr family phosphocarrier protein [Spirochaeta cellobiosiphila]|uniref:HPr family phosphocarrier protein n=1 Tax=Spirochaeta cellobiosiphila TaxID=504483 RepID=UPI00041442B6|nr:HPr family phosphocarrier protein [Spirochaeta cellobiosiphila]